MRRAADLNGVSVKAYAGTTGVILAMDVAGARRTGLLGFAIEREDLTGPRKGRRKWLSGGLHFRGVPRPAGIPVPSNEGPIQKFRWSDYTVYPDSGYAYTVHPAYGEPGDLDIRDGPRVDVATSGLDGAHGVIFNRAAAASQAFATRFPEVQAALDAARKAKKPLAGVELPPKAYTWLSRGLLDRILAFIGAATDARHGLDIAIYEYELPAIRKAVADAAARGVTIRIVYHARAGDEQTSENAKSLETPRRPRPSSASSRRSTGATRRPRRRTTSTG